MDIKLVNDQVKSILAGGINNEKLKEKVEEYIEISKLKLKIAKEILELTRESSKTESYLSELEKDIALAEEEITKETLNSKIL